MDLTTYITQTSGMSLRAIAEAAGVQNTKLSRQLNGTSTLTMETLRDISRGTGLDMLDLFTRADLITPEEAADIRAGFDVTRLTDQQLAAEVLRRMERGSETLEQPINAPLEAPNVSDLSVRRRRVTAEDVTEQDLQSQAAYRPEADETPDRDNY